MQIQRLSKKMDQGTTSKGTIRDTEPRFEAYQSDAS